MRSSPNAGISPAEAVPDSDEAAAEDTSDLEESAGKDTSDLEESAGVGDVAEDVPGVEQAVRKRTQERIKHIIFFIAVNTLISHNDTSCNNIASDILQYKTKYVLLDHFHSNILNNNNGEYHR